MGARDSGRFGVIAVSVFALSQIAQSSINYFTHDASYFHWAIVTSIATIVLWYALPSIITYRLEKKDARSLGLTIGREKYIPYTIYAIIGLVFPAFLVGFDTELAIEFIEQIVYIGLAEEFFYRGYLLNRFCKWLGDWKGLFLSALLFGLGHIIARLAEHGLGSIIPATQAAMQAFLGGLIFGYIYLRAKNIWPSAVAHVSSNMYIYRIIALFGI
jgi:membrane protease YdiL (CAAX protease family)